MRVQRWQSFSCNNSSSYYLVARFENADSANASATELNEFLAEHARQAEAMDAEGNDAYGTPTQACLELAKKHEFEWTETLTWSTGEYVGDEPDVYVMGKTLVIEHTYCGGFGESVPSYFKARGAEAEKEQTKNPVIAVRFSYAPDNAAAPLVWSYVEELAAFAAEEDGWAIASEVSTPPWGSEPTEDMEFESGSRFPAFNDGETIGFALELMRFSGWQTIADYLTKSGIGDFVVDIDRPEVLETFRAIGTASCPECATKPLRYLEAAKHDADADQLACSGCQGMFAVALFMDAPA